MRNALHSLMINTLNIEYNVPLNQGRIVYYNKAAN